MLFLLDDVDVTDEGSVGFLFFIASFLLLLPTTLVLLINTSTRIEESLAMPLVCSRPSARHPPTPSPSPASHLKSAAGGGGGEKKT